MQGPNASARVGRLERGLVLLTALTSSGHRRPNGKWEARYRPKSKVKLDEVECMELTEAYRGFDAAKKLHKYVGLATWRLDSLRLGFECLHASSPCHPFPHTIAHRHHPPPSIPPS